MSQGKFSVSLVSNRLDRINDFKEAALGFSPRPWSKNWGRMDMFWISFTPTGESKSKYRWAVEARDTSEGGIYLSNQSYPHTEPPKDITRAAEAFFIHSPYYRQMQQWHQQIDRDFRNTLELVQWEKCAVCKQEFAKGTKHQHYANEYHFGPWHGREAYEEMKKAGIEPNWRPGYSHASDPPLEEIFTPEQIEKMQDNIEYRKMMFKIKRYGEYGRQKVKPLPLPK